MTFSKLLIFLLTIMAAAGSASAQTSPEKGTKVKLIQEFREATGADKVNLKIDLSLDETKKSLTDMVEKEAGLTVEQRSRLRTSVDEAYLRLETSLNAFLEDRDHITTAAEQVIFATYDKAFTEDELSELAAYYRSPLGKKGLAFLRSINQDFEQAFQERMVTEVSRIIKPKIENEFDLLRKKIAEAKASN